MVTITQLFLHFRFGSTSTFIPKLNSTMGDERMPKVDFIKDKANLKHTALDYMKLVEKQNLERVQKLKRIQRGNLITGCLLGVGVFGVYMYSMLAVKQERFLDDFDEPAKTEEKL